MTVLPGQKFSYLTVTARWSGSRWVCRCECGGETIAKAADLKHGKVRSCGCVRRPAVAHAPKPKRQSEGPLGTAVDHRAWSPVVRRVLPDLSGGASALPAFPRATESAHAWSADQWRTWVAEDWLGKFTAGELAVLRIVADEVRARGRCVLCLDEIVARAGVCRRLAQDVLREAERLGLARIEEGRVSAFAQDWLLRCLTPYVPEERPWPSLWRAKRLGLVRIEEGRPVYVPEEWP